MMSFRYKTMAIIRYHRLMNSIRHEHVVSYISYVVHRPLRIFHVI